MRSATARAAQGERRERFGARAGAVPFWLYKNLISPVLHTCGVGACLYRPTCSEYAYVALARFGPLRGSWLAFRRLLRCHPWARGGFDPVPQRRSSSHARSSEHLP